MGCDIAFAEMESAVSVTVYPAEALRKWGANTPIEGLRQLPFFVGTTETENDSSGGDGRAFINLYGLGSNNTLTLINGRRAFGFSDINAIPISALSRAEVLNGGSANYGSDAVAGVVNFILLNGPGEQPYEGSELHALYGNTTDADAHVRQVYLRGGVTGLDGKVSIAAAGEYYSRANLFGRDREISANADNSNNPTGNGWGGLNNNSPTYAGRVNVAASGTAVGLVTGVRTLINLGQGGSIMPGDYRRFDSAGPGTDPDRFNFRAFTPAIPAQVKAMYYVTGRYKIFSDGLQIYGDIMYSRTKQDNAIAGVPFAVLGTVGTGSAAVASSPYSPFGRYLTDIRYRLQQELGNRESFFDSDYHRYVIGVNGDFTFKDNGFISRLGYDTGFVYENYTQQRTDSGDAQFTPLFGEIQAGNFNPFIGQNAPLQGTAITYVTDPATGASVPIGTQSYDNRAAAARASYIGHSFFYERDYLYDLKVNLHLFPNFWNGGIDLFAGYEHREVNPKQISDSIQAANDQLGFDPVPPFKYRQEVDSWLFELNIPLITATMNVPLVRSLDVGLSWRRDEFRSTNLLLAPQSPAQTSASFTNENPGEDFAGSPTVTLRYQPFSDLLFRASWRQSIRPPNFEELFTPITQIFPVLFGPELPPPIQPPLGTWVGGNPEVQPETTDSYSVGVVWAPTFAPGLAVTVDAYQMFTTNVILDPESFTQFLVAGNVLDPDGCGNGFVGDPDCNGGPADGLTRDPDTGNLLAIDSGFGNAGKRLVQGVEATAAYELPTERLGKFTLSGGYNHFFTWKAQPGTGPFRSFLGNYDNRTLPFTPGAIPWNKGFLRGEWKWRHFAFIATGNYIGDFRSDPSFDGIVRDEPRTVPSYLTLDMQVSYEFVKPDAEAPVYAKDNKNVISAPVDPSGGSIWQRLLWGTKITVGVNNAFNRNPPTVLAAPNDNYDTSLYSIRNRYYYVALSKKF